MPKPNHLQGEKRWRFLERAKTIRLASLDADGGVYLSPLWYVVLDKKIYLPMDAGSRHVTNARDDKPVYGLVDAGDEYATVHGARIEGRLTDVSDPELIESLTAAVMDKYFYGDTHHPYAQAYTEFGVFAGRSFSELVPTKMIGWDMREVSVPAMPESRTFPPGTTDRLLPESVRGSASAVTA